MYYAKHHQNLKGDHPSLEILITLGCAQRKQPPNSMNLWQKPMGNRTKYYKKPKPLSDTSFEPLSTTTKG